jgi:glycosyltransferase involved in cell wall biosynthesis
VQSRPSDQAVAGSARRSVLQLLNGEQYSGLERVVDHLIAGAPGQGFRMVLALLKPHTMRSRMLSGCDAIHEVPMRSRFDLRVADAAARVATESACTLVHSHTVRSALVARRVQRLTHLPWVHHVHSPALYESQRRGMNLMNFVAEAAVMRNADAVITVTESLASYVTRSYRVAPNRVSVVPNGVVDKSFANTKRAQATALTVLAVGLFRPRKGIEHLVGASALLAAAGHNFRLQLAGEFADRSHEAKIRAQVERLGLVELVDFAGFIPNVTPALSACDVFVLPSLYGEGMPMAVLEAMAVGLPIVASDIDGTRQLLDGGAGLLVQPGSAHSLAEAIGRLLTDAPMRRKLALAAQRRQRQRHSVTGMQSRVFGVYRRLLADDAFGTPGRST